MSIQTNDTVTSTQEHSCDFLQEIAGFFAAHNSSCVHFCNNRVTCNIDAPDARLCLRVALNQQRTITTARYAAMQCARPRCASMCSPIQMRVRTQAGSCAARDATMVSQAANMETRSRRDSGLRVAGVMLLTVFRVTWTWQDAS